MKQPTGSLSSVQSKTRGFLQLSRKAQRKSMKYLLLQAGLPLRKKMRNDLFSVLKTRKIELLEDKTFKRFSRFAVISEYF